VGSGIDHERKAEDAAHLSGGGLTVGVTTTVAHVPFVDLQRHHASVATELRSSFDRVLDSSGFILGTEVEDFEADFAAFCEVEHCIGVASGTAALTLAMLAAGIGPGDEVIVPAHTYIASALAVMHAGAEPVLCDVEAGTGLIDIRSAADVISPRTAAILPVHLYGQVCDMDAVTTLARRHGLLVIEDAAQAHGGQYRAKRAGSLGDAAAFSFYPSKNLGALGDGGAICTNVEEIATKARRLRSMGEASKGEHLMAGFNERLDGLQAAMLRVKLRRLEAANAMRRARAETYRAVLPLGCRALEEDPRGECVYHLFPVRVENRDEVRAGLAARSIGTGVHYWPAVHNQPPLAGCRRGDVMRAEQWSAQELSLPMFPEITEDEVRLVGEALTEVLEESQ
jgi:dTDP-4-amino-4,6-dideoxygalactose transaminase